MKKNAAFITGGARRIGAALSLHFARAGYDIALHYNSSKTQAEELQQEIIAIGVDCEIFCHDFADFAGLSGLVSDVKEKFPNCQMLINNASVFERAEFLQTDEELFDRQFNINLKAVFFLTQHFAKIIGKGSVINILDTDIANNQISHFAYLMSKKSLADFTKMSALALAPEIRVNAVAPSIMLPSADHDLDYMKKLEKILPLRANPDLNSLCETSLLLANQPHITGQIIHVDCGKHLL